MKELIVAIKDRAIDAFMRPWTVPHANAAIRGMLDETNRVDSEIHKHPEDYDLYQLGTFDQQTGLIEGLDMPKMLVRAQDLIAKE